MVTGENRNKIRFISWLDSIGFTLNVENGNGREHLKQIGLMSIGESLMQPKSNLSSLNVPINFFGANALLEDLGQKKRLLIQVVSRFDRMWSKQVMWLETKICSERIKSLVLVTESVWVNIPRTSDTRLMNLGFVLSEGTAVATVYSNSSRTKRIMSRARPMGR
ncbi:hypothetical protein BpHYR1_024024 [Brachionus plicatilis]|uniref:Uncharacterized protein n=1 Tax=Brachionus plicatilis TaxID=10195 RepID=A0A3M7SJ04_BRAPC|nr:hypothetical protein BpHYR1_024024 [Brachionus plicatilis]